MSAKKSGPAKPTPTHARRAARAERRVPGGGTVLVVDDDRAFAGYLATEFGAWNVEVAHDLVTARQMIRDANDVRLALIDLYLTRRSRREPEGLRLVALARECHPAAMIVAVSGNSEPAYINLLQARYGAGFLVKGGSLREALAELARRLHRLRPALERRVAALIEHHDIPRREAQVLTHAARGWTLQHIANEYDLSVETVKTYALRLRRRLGAASVREIVARLQTGPA